MFAVFLFPLMIIAIGQTGFLKGVDAFAASRPSSLRFVARELVVRSAKKKRRRKQVPDSTNGQGENVSRSGAAAYSVDEEEELSDDDLAMMKDIANFEFQPDGAISTRFDVDETDDEEASPFQLPDIKDVLKKKELEKEFARIEAEEIEAKPKIKRSDTEAFKKLLESEPFADADDKYFEEEEYDTVSALLGERAKPFLGIPIGPLQVGHFVGALGIVLMAFVQYPGFPLTNLPTAVRDCLQGGLAMIYMINIILAVLSVFKATERGQPVPLWAAKTFVVGGLAFDQLTQLPTLEEISKAETKPGKKGKKRR